MVQASVFDEPSRRNRTDKRLHGKEGSSTVDSLFRLAKDARKASGKKGYGKYADDIKRHVEIIVADLFSAWIADPDLYVGYSRNEKAFDPDGSYHGALKHSAFMDVLEVLEKNDLIEDNIQTPGYAGRSSSCMRATQKLADIIHGEGVNWASIVHDQDAEVLVLKSEKDKDGNTVEMSFDDSDDHRIPSMRKNIQRINEKLSRTLINLDVTDAEYADIVSRSRKDPNKDQDDPNKGSLDFSNRNLRRVFNNGSWEDGGRFYGGWWQAIPKKYRRHIQIEGKQTVEWDYSSIHPTILYAMEGHPAPSDAYDIPDWDIQHRGLIKKAFNQLLNSAPSTKPEGQWRLLAPDTIPVTKPSGWEEMKDYERAPYQREEFKLTTNKDYDKLINDIINRHPIIQKHFFSRAWSWLQKADSIIAEKVMIEMLEKDIVVLPVHDSFLVRRGFEGYLKRSMNTAFQEVIEAVPRMKADHQLVREEDWLVDDISILVAPTPTEDSLKEDIKKHRGCDIRTSQWKWVWGLEGWD